MKKVLIFIFIAVVLLGSFFSYEKREAKILFVGDMFFDRHLRKVMYNKGGDYIFSCVGDFIKNADVVVGNLEGPVTENASVSLISKVESSENYIFTFPTNVPALLHKYNIKIVNLGNNHIGNFGKEGIDSTQKYLTEAGVKYFGGLAGDEAILREDFGGNKISFISYNEFGGDSAQKVAGKIAEEKEAGRNVIVYAHWGDEYVVPPQRIKNYAKIFSEAGVDFIIGSHPHVVLESEKINETIVYYSLGNFIFDQYWNREVSTGLVLELNIKNNKFEILEHRVSINKDGTTCLIN